MKNTVAEKYISFRVWLKIHSQPCKNVTAGSIFWDKLPLSRLILKTLPKMCWIESKEMLRSSVVSLMRTLCSFNFFGVILITRDE